ncbi:MAG: GGDEF domain-containing protein [Desulfarculaceae bacterium]|nr:GGDEF domain-containing protein [Desulfarculaceae bacterium]MCF8049357.1 GGDEF domain-containing protein [Desulfarculaceae bacterium]MCF8066310.1 GGDEF domain-containing protein [Desulfarculaceae bacterium]MCF8099354.1 GGDEF domain-containing protein [Desulfarculaceae bacterium]MCF8123395.1 GGDEF domain-containing protein [Desulfarculaceae bacterium]
MAQVARDRADIWFSVKNKKDVAKATFLVTSIAVLGSWAVTTALMLLAGHTEAEDWVVGLTIATLAPLVVAPPVAYKVLNLMLALVDSRREIERLSRTDDLTQTYNRRHFMEMAQRELSLATRHGYVVSMLLIDLDDFKQVNDRLGHLAGDRALAACAATIRSSIRREDVVGRFGGDEFLVLASYSDLSSAAMLAGRIRRALASADSVVGGQAMGFKASIGVVSSEGRTGDADELLRQADKALYRAKHMGGDRIELAA